MGLTAFYIFFVRGTAFHMAHGDDWYAEASWMMQMLYWVGLHLIAAMVFSLILGVFEDDKENKIDA
jgi:hypothetical protein